MSFVSVMFNCIQCHIKATITDVNVIESNITKGGTLCKEINMPRFTAFRSKLCQRSQRENCMIFSFTHRRFREKSRNGKMTDNSVRVGEYIIFTHS